MTTTFVGDKCLYGIVPDLPVRLNSFGSYGDPKWRIRARPQEFAFIFLRYIDRIEQWYLGSDGTHLFPLIKKSENRRG